MNRTTTSQKTEIIPANSDIPCGCCGRYHRKIKKVDGWWMGGNCEAQYRLYQSNQNINSFVWRGYESQYRKIAKMVTGK
jgi:hypothetical protein